MASFLSYIPVVNLFVGGNATQWIDIPPVETHNVETDPEKRPRTLKPLLRANHVNHSILYPCLCIPLFKAITLHPNPRISVFQ